MKVILLTDIGQAGKYIKGSTGALVCVVALGGHLQSDTQWTNRLQWTMEISITGASFGNIWPEALETVGPLRAGLLIFFSDSECTISELV